MHIDFTVQTVFYVVAAILFIAAVVWKPRSGEALAVGLAVFALAHIIH